MGLCASAPSSLVQSACFPSRRAVIVQHCTRCFNSLTFFSLSKRMNIFVWSDRNSTDTCTHEFFWAGQRQRANHPSGSGWVEMDATVVCIAIGLARSEAEYWPMILAPLSSPKKLTGKGFFLRKNPHYLLQLLQKFVFSP